MATRLKKNTVAEEPAWRTSRRVRAERLPRRLMGSDYPRGEIETPVGFVSTAGLSEPDRDRILSRNALDLFGIP